MPKKEIAVDYEGHSIRVSNTWFAAAKLYIDGECRDTSYELVALGGKPILCASLDSGGAQTPIEVYVRAVFNVTIKICAGGKQIAGDSF